MVKTAMVGAGRGSATTGNAIESIQNDSAALSNEAEHSCAVSSLITQRYPCFTLSGGFSHVTAWRIVTFFPPIHPMGSGLEISI